VPLRIIEYYDGIIDASFTFRIQLLLHHNPLNPQSRRKLWRNFCDTLHRRDLDLEDLLGTIDELVAYEMNGRHNRNVLTTARQLAVFKIETLVCDHVEQALKCVRDFSRYLSGLHDYSEEQWARDERLR
jgi:hypothetical protein